MESVGTRGNLGESSGFLVIPNGSSFDEYEYEVEGRIKPKSSPLPRRRGSMSSDDSEPEPPPNRHRKVSFADAFGLSLVSVKEFDHRDVSSPAAALEALEGAAARDAEEHFLSSLFTVPSSPEELLQKLQDQMCELECVELLPGTTSVRGTIRVLNLSYDKMVYVRTTLDGWATHFDLLAEFVPGSSDGETDRFMFKITLVPPFRKEGARVEFCLRYEVPGRTFWANNNGMNYVFFCHKRSARDAKENQLEDAKYKNKKSCLKTMSKDSFERTSVVLPGEISDVPIEKHEVVLTVEYPVPHSEGLHDDGGQTEPVNTNHDYSWRSRRRAARLARIKNLFYQNEGEAEEGGQEEEEEDSRCTDATFDLRPLHWATTSELLRIPHTEQTNGKEEAEIYDPVPPPSHRDGHTDTFEEWSREYLDASSADLQEVDTVLYPPAVRASALSSWESWNTFVNFEDAEAPSVPTEPEEAAPQEGAFDSAAYLEEDSTEQPEPSNGAPTESQPESESQGSSLKYTQTDTVDLRYHEREAENWPVVDGWGSKSTPTDGDSEHEAGSATHDGVWTGVLDVWQRFPFDSYLTAAARHGSSGVGHKSASDDLLKRDTSAARHKEPVNSQDKDPLHRSQFPQQAEDTDPEVILDDDIGSAAECVREHRHISGGDAFAGAVDYSEETDTQTEVTEKAVTEQSPKPEPASEISADEFDNIPTSSAIDTGIDNPFMSHVTFAMTVRGMGDHVKDTDEEACRDGRDKEEDNSKDNAKGPYKVKTEASLEKENSFHENKEDLTAEETKDPHAISNEDVFLERGDLCGDDMSAEGRDDPYEEEIVMDLEEDLYDEEDVSMENEDEADEEEENEDFYGQEELPISKEEEPETLREEVRMRTKDLDLEQEDVLEETEEDLEVAQILGGINQALKERNEAPSIEIEEADKGKGKASWEMEYRKGNEEHTNSERQVNVREEGRVSRESKKLGEGLSWEKEELLHDGGTVGAFSAQSLPDNEKESNMLSMDHAPPPVFKPQATPGNCRNTPTNDNTDPSVGSVRMRPAFIPPMDKSKYPREYSEAAEVPGSPQADLDPVEEPAYHATVHLPPVEKVENVARNDLLCWWDLSSQNVSRVFLYGLLCLIFLVTAFHYDFLVCFAFYLITMCWFCFHRENGIEQAER